MQVQIILSLCPRSFIGRTAPAAGGRGGAESGLGRRRRLSPRPPTGSHAAQPRSAAHKLFVAVLVGSIHKQLFAGSQGART